MATGKKQKHADSASAYRLSPEDYQLYLKLHQNLLVFAAQKLGSKIKNRDDFLRLTLEEQVNIRDGLIKRIRLIDEFVGSNPCNLTPSELEILKSWKDCVSGRFFLIDYTENGATFLEAVDKDPKAYRVLALGIPLWEVVPMPPPLRVATVLLPFRGRIVYDGFITADRVLFGSGMARSIRATCNRAVVEHGLVESLPYEKSAGFSEEEKLSFYLGTKERREENWEEIEELLQKSKDLLPVYSREMGRANSRLLKKRLKAVGARKGWFAVADDVIVAASKTRNDLENLLEHIMPNHGKDSVYIFELK